MTAAIVGLISMYGKKRRLTRIEVSVTVPATRTLLAHKAWVGTYRSLDAVADDVMAFCTSHHVAEVQIADTVFPATQAGRQGCVHCGGDVVRVPWA
jgi:hypothetical protein